MSEPRLFFDLIDLTFLGGCDGHSNEANAYRHQAAPKGNFGLRTRAAIVWKDRPLRRSCSSLWGCKGYVPCICICICMMYTPRNGRPDERFSFKSNTDGIFRTSALLRLSALKGSRVKLDQTDLSSPPSQLSLENPEHRFVLGMRKKKTSSGDFGRTLGSEHSEHFSLEQMRVG